MRWAILALMILITPAAFAGDLWYAQTFGAHMDASARVRMIKRKRGKSVGRVRECWPRCILRLRNVGGFSPIRRLTSRYAALACPHFCPSYGNLP